MSGRWVWGRFGEGAIAERAAHVSRLVRRRIATQAEAPSGGMTNDRGARVWGT